MENPRFQGTVICNGQLTVRDGPGENYPIIPDKTVSPGSKLDFSDIVKSGSTYWGVMDDGFVKISQGSNRYIRYEKTYPDVVFLENENWNGSTQSGISVGQPTNKTITPTPVNVEGSQPVMNASMRLFGLPYQFNPACDPRYDNISPVVGREFSEKFFTDGALMYIIPGKAKYIDDGSKKTGNITSHAIISASSGDMGPLRRQLESARKKPVMFYDFQEDYNNYMNYVNAMCRTVASFLELKDGINGEEGNYFQKYDWRNYRWTSDSYQSSTSVALNYVKDSAKSAVNYLRSIGSALLGQSKTAKTDSVTRISMNDGSPSKPVNLNQIGGQQNYVMFYVDPTTSCNESFINDTSESELQQQIDSWASQARDYAFYAKSAGAEGIVEKGEELLAGFAGGVSSAAGMIPALGNVMQKMISASASVIKGENIILPEIYQNSRYQKDYQITIHLKTPYGDKLSVYTDVIVPMLHLVALAVPKQATANTYASPFLVKVYVPGVFNCGLGIVTGLQLDKARSEDAWSMDGLPMEVDVTMSIKDLYSRMSMSPSHEPQMFLNNSSLIDYLSNVAGLNLILPQTSTKLEMIINTHINAITDIPKNLGAAVTDGIGRLFSSYVSL